MFEQVIHDEDTAQLKGPWCHVVPFESRGALCSFARTPASPEQNP
jgi:hypothetical protein